MIETSVPQASATAPGAVASVPAVLLEGHGLTRQFPGVRALEGVDIMCPPAHILALVGENGAGKSTLCNVLGGVLQPDAGWIVLDGRPVRIADPQHARRLGIGFVHQETTLLPQLTVGENIMLNHEPTRFGIVSQRALHEAARRVLDQITIGLDVDEMTYRLPPASLQMVEIAKAWSDDPRVLMLDEPTSSLSSAETEHLFAMLRAFRARGTSLVFISHRLDEVFEVADDVMVMKDGRVVARRPADELTRDDVISLMVGRQMTQAFPPHRTTPPGPAVFEARGVSIADRVHEVDLVVGAGEIVGLGGLAGQGQRELVRVMFGLEALSAGSLLVDGAVRRLRGPADALAAGVAFVPDDRKAEGVVPAMGVADNMVLASLRRVSHLGIVSRARQRSLVGQFVDSLEVRTPSLDQRVRTLSGGNQQKVVFAKWLMTDPRILLLDEPTRGIDVETKVQIYSLLRRLADQGRGVLLLSSDMLELIGCSDRIYVMYEGRVTGTLAGDEATEERLMQLGSGIVTGVAS